MTKYSPYLLKEVPLTDLEGKTLIKFKEKDVNEIVFYTANNERYVLKNDYYKNQQIIGNFDDLLNFSLKTFSEVSCNPGYEDLISTIKITTIASSMHIKWYIDYEKAKKEIDKRNKEQE